MRHKPDQARADVAGRLLGKLLAAHAACPQSLLKNLWIKKGNLAGDLVSGRTLKDKAIATQAVIRGQTDISATVRIPPFRLTWQC